MTLVVLELSIGGLEIAVVNLASTLAGRGVPVRLVVLEQNEHTLDEAIAQSVDVVDLTGCDPVTRLTGLRRAVRRSLVHVHFWGGKVRPHYRAVMLDRPTVATYHNIFQRPRAVDTLDSVVQRNTRVIISSSQFVDAYAQRVLDGPAQRYRVITNPAVLPVTAQEPPPRHKGAPWQIVIVSRLVAQKDVATALRGFALARHSGLQARLTVIGEGSQLPRLLSEARRLRITEAVSWLGEVTSRSELAELLRHAHLKIYTSRWDSFPLVLLEAMATGVPVIATDVPGNREALGTAAAFVPVGDPLALAECITQVLAAPDRLLTMRTAGLARVTSFTPDRHADEHLAVYRSLGGSWAPKTSTAQDRGER